MSENPSSWLDPSGASVAVADDIVKSDEVTVNTVAGINGVPIVGTRGTTPAIGVGYHYNQVGTPGHKLKKGVMPGHIDLVDFGAIEGVNDAPSRAANQAAYAAAVASMSSGSSALGQRIVAHGVFHFNDTLHVNKSLWIDGINSSFSTHEPATQFTFPKNCDGVRFHAGGAGDEGPLGETGSSAFAKMSNVSLVCRDHNDSDIENLTGTPATLQTLTGYWRDYSVPTWAGNASAGTSSSRGFVTAGHDPTQGFAFRQFADAGGAGATHGSIPYPKTAQFDGTQYLVGDGSTKLSDLISLSAYALQFVVEFTASSAAAGSVHDDAAIFTDSSGDCIFVVYTTNAGIPGIRAGHKDSGGIKLTPAIPLPLNTPATIQVQYDGTNIKCRVEGVSTETSVAAGSVVGTLSSLTPRIGANYNGAHGIVGRIGQILAFNTAPGWTVLENLRTNARIAYGHTCFRGHGIRTSAQIHLSNVHVDNFGENGLAIFADESSPPEIYGNASGTVVERCSFDGNGGHGVHIYGGDASVCKIDATSFAGNHGWGIYEESLTGGHISICHAEGNRGHQEEDGANRDYTNPTNNFSVFTTCYTEDALNLINGNGTCDGLLAAALHPDSTAFAIASGIVYSKSVEHRNNRGTTEISTNCMRPGDTMHGFEWAVLDGLGNDVDRHAMFYNGTSKWWSVEMNGFHNRMIQYPTRLAFEREPTAWCENGIKIGRDDAGGTPILFTGEAFPRPDTYAGFQKTYEKGDTVWQSQPVAGGPLGSRCLTSGTQGALNGSATTATTTSGSAVIAVSDYTDLVPGQYITIAGVSGTKKVLTVAGTTITLTTTCGASVGPGAAVSYVHPTFETFGGSTAPPSVTPVALDLDWSKSNVFEKTLAAGANTITFSNMASGQTVSAIMTGAASTATFPDVDVWLNGGTPPTQTASGTDVYTFIKGAALIYGIQAPA